MKNAIAYLFATLFLITALTAPLTLSGRAQEQTTGPDWVITEVGANQQGNDANTNGYTADVGKDCFEFIEIYNNSGRELNLYDYAITFSNSKRPTAEFEHDVQRYTPFKPGDYLDNASLVANTGAIGDLSNKPVNPDTCIVAPGEVVVLWIVYYEAYLAVFNDGKGMAMDDFRAHWGIPADVKVIAVDGNGNTANGGNAKNFNVVNSGCGTYGIVLQNEAMEQTANAEEGVFEGAYTRNADFACWVSLDYENLIIFGELINLTMNFTWDYKGYAIKDQFVTDVASEEYTYDARRSYLLSAGDTPTPGSLNTLQKMTLGVALEAGESYAFCDEYMYWPMLGEKTLGFKINGELYEGEVTFIAPEAGIYELDFYFERDLYTTEELPTEAPEQTTEAESTEAVTETSTEVQTQPEQEKSGCRAIMGAAMLPCLAIAVILVKKHRD